MFSHTQANQGEFGRIQEQIVSNVKLPNGDVLKRHCHRRFAVFSHNWLKNETWYLIDSKATTHSLCVDQKIMLSNELPRKAIQIKIWRIKFGIKFFIKN